MCMRCFRLKNYGEYESVSSSMVDYDGIIEGINNTNEWREGLCQQLRAVFLAHLEQVVTR